MNKGDILEQVNGSLRTIHTYTTAQPVRPTYRKRCAL